jgi:hypothetical protein
MQMRWTHSLLAALLAAHVAPAAAVNKCTAPDGQVVYQDAPCFGSQPGDKVNLSGAGQAQPNSAGARGDRVALAISNREVAVGMTGPEVLRSWGRPTKVNTTVSAAGKREQWVYRHGRGVAQYVYLENGRVSSMQSSE